MPLWLVISNVIAEYLRRANTQMNTIQVADRRLGEVSDVTYLKSPDPVPEGARLVQLKSSTPASGGTFGIIGVAFATTAIIFMVVISVLK